MTKANSAKSKRGGAQKGKAEADPVSIVAEDGVVRAGIEDVWVEARGEFKPDAVTGYTPSPESERLLVSAGQQFEGPLDLLLHLIRKDGIDIFDIPIAHIVERYLKVLDDMANLDLDIAGEFLVMASTLAHIKSKMLLPKEPDPDGQEEVDPRAELVRRLLEYQRYQDVAEKLGERPWLGRDVFQRSPEACAVELKRVRKLAGQEVPQEPMVAPLVEVEPLELIKLLSKMMKKAKKQMVHEVVLERLNVGARINELIDFARDREHFTYLDVVNAFGGVNRLNLIVSLLAVLEMVKLKFIKLHQVSIGGAIYLTPISENLEVIDEDLLEFDDYATPDAGDGDQG